MHSLKQNQEQKKGNFLVSCSPNKVAKEELFSVVQSRADMYDTRRIYTGSKLRTRHPPHYEQSLIP